MTQQLVGLPALGCGEFCYCGSIETDNVPQVQKNAILDCADALAGEFDIRGVWGIDFILNEAGAYPVDINCRITASAELTESRLREHSDFKSVLDLHVTACEKGLDDFTTPPQSSSAQGKLILFNRLDIPITISNSIFEVLTDGNSRGELADIPNLGTAIQPGFPIVTLKASQDNAASTKENMLHDAEQLYSLFQNGNA